VISNLNLAGRFFSFLPKRRFSLLVFLLLGGCSTAPLTDPIIGPDFVPNNVYRQSPKLPPTIRRAVVLPLGFDSSDTLAIAGREVTEPILHSELSKQARFELVFVSPDQLRLWTGRDRWDFQEALPREFLSILREKTGAEAIFFPYLTQYSPYPPIRIGWRFKLTTATDGDVLWSADEVFDAGFGPVSNSARRYARAHLNKIPVLEDSRAILLSPSAFAQYTLSALLDTIPGR
jgi:hypothetical protein